MGRVGDFASGHAPVLDERVDAVQQLPFALADVLVGLIGGKHLLPGAPQDALTDQSRVGGGGAARNRFQTMLISVCERIPERVHALEDLSLRFGERGGAAGKFLGIFLLHEAHRPAQELQDLEPLGRRDAVGIQLVELREETNVGWADIDERQGLQPLRAAGGIREIRSSVRLDARGIEARHGSVQSALERG